MVRSFGSSVVSLACAALLGALAGACADRPADADYSAYIEDSCTISCGRQQACGFESYFEDVDECLDDCIGSQKWEDLDQCDSAELKFMRCYGAMTCDELGAYNAWVFGDDSSTDFPCFILLVDTYNCDPAEPFEAPVEAPDA